MPRLLLLLLALPLALPPAPARALAPLADPGGQCRTAIAAAERAFAIPTGLMAAIGLVESGRRRADGRVDPWPWSIDAEGSGHVYDSKADAIAAVQSLQAKGVRSIDVGCMQVNLLHHPDAFASLDAAFDPAANVAFAARFLLQLHATAGSWPAAAALYHSATPALAADYRRKVMAAWPAGFAEAAAATPADAAAGMPVPSVGGLTSGGAPLAHRLLRNPGSPPAMAPPPGQTGRSLANYRAAPVQLAVRVLPHLPGRN